MKNDKQGTLIFLESVGTAIDEDTLMTYPVLDTETFQIDEEMGVHIWEVDAQWFYELDEKDALMVDILTSYS